MTDDQKAPVQPASVAGLIGRQHDLQVSEGYVMLPAKLTAENGAKSALMGEFHEHIETECPECEGGLSDNYDGCPECGGEWVVYEKVTVSWDTIKRIHDAVVQHFATRQPLPTSAVPDGYVLARSGDVDSALRALRYAAHPERSPHADDLESGLLRAAPQQGGEG